MVFGACPLESSSFFLSMSEGLSFGTVSLCTRLAGLVLFFGWLPIGRLSLSLRGRKLRGGKDEAEL